ncbi:MAG: carbohydrate-binding protein [Oscillospiraceae bacterium]|nr:carbohydrate-binding protein [Oscillospiraceae bacterium]
MKNFSRGISILVILSLTMALLTPLAVSADAPDGFSLGDFNFFSDPGISGWATNGRDGVETGLDLETLKAAKSLYVEFSEDIDAGLEFILQSDANWWDQLSGAAYVDGNILIADLTAFDSWNDFIASGTQANIFIGSWSNNYWESISVVNAVLTESVLEPTAGPEYVYEPADKVIGGAFSVIRAVDFDADGWLDNNDGNYEARPEMEELGGPQTEADNVGWIDAGEYVSYTVHVEQGGEYLLVVRAGSGGSGGDVDFYIGEEKIASVAVTPTGGWGNYAFFDAGTVNLEAGNQVIRVEFPDGGLNFSRMLFIAPFDTNPYVLNVIGDGTTVVKAVEFDNDGFHEFTYDFHSVESSWFSDDSWTADGAFTFRPEYFEGFTGPQTEGEIDVPGLGDIGAVAWTSGEWTNPDDEFIPAEWVQYTVIVPEAGQYAVSVWASSGDGAETPLNVYANAELAGAPVIEENGWADYGLYDVAVVDLEAGVNVFTVEFPAGGINFAALVFNQGTSFAQPPPPPAPPAPPAPPVVIDGGSGETGGGEAVGGEGEGGGGDEGEKLPAPTGDSLAIILVLALVAAAAFATARKIRVKR